MIILKVYMKYIKTVEVLVRNHSGFLWMFIVWNNINSRVSLQLHFELFKIFLRNWRQMIWIISLTVVLRFWGFRAGFLKYFKKTVENFLRNKQYKNLL